MTTLGITKQLCPTCDVIPPCPQCSPNEVCQQVYSDDCLSCPENICVRQPAQRLLALVIGLVCGVVVALLLLSVWYWFYRKCRRSSAQIAAAAILPDTECSASTFKPLPTFQVQQNEAPRCERIVKPMPYKLALTPEQPGSPKSSGPTSSSSGTKSILAISKNTKMLAQRQGSESSEDSPRPILCTSTSPSPSPAPERLPNHLCKSYCAHSSLSGSGAEDGTCLDKLDEMHNKPEDVCATDGPWRGSAYYAFLHTLVDEYDQGLHGPQHTGSSDPTLRRADSAIGLTFISTGTPQTRSTITNKERGMAARRSSLFSDVRKRIGRRRSASDTRVLECTDEQGPTPKTSGQFKRELFSSLLLPPTETGNNIGEHKARASSVLLAYAEEISGQTQGAWSERRY